VTITGEFAHSALFYRSDEEYLDALTPFLGDGLTRGEPVAVAAPRARLELLRPALGGSADRVRWIDMTEAGRNPGRIIPSVLDAFADRHPGRRVRIVGEPVWAGRSVTEYPACAQHEALINHAFAGRGATIVCPYDASALDPAVVDDARATHPEVWEDGARRTSDRYAPDEVIARYNQRLRGSRTGPAITCTADHEVRQTRHWAAWHARLLGLAEARVPDLELIVTELATNSLRHSSGGCRVTLWRDGDHLWCSVEDGGHLTDPLAGRRVPEPAATGGRGLLLVHQLADLVRTHTVPGHTTQYASLRLRSWAVSPAAWAGW